MTPVPAPADKRFRRAKVSPAHKRRWKLTWPLAARASAALVIVAVALYWTVNFVLASEALTVTRITVDGNVRLSRGEVLSLLDGLSGASIVTTDLESWRQKLLTSPWVADASIRRMFPGTLAVAIAERKPIGIGRIKGGLYLIDGSGVIIDEFGPNYADFDLPIVDGLTPTGEQGEAVVEARAALAGRLMTELQPRPSLARQVSQIDVTDARNAIVILKGDTALLRVGNERFAERLQAYVDLMPALQERMPDIDYVDLRFDERVYVRPQTLTRRPVSAAQPTGKAAPGPRRRRGR